MSSDKPLKVKTFDDLFQESHKAQRKFAARVTVYGGQEGLAGDGRFPLPKQYGRHSQEPTPLVEETSSRSAMSAFEKDRPPALSPVQSRATLSEYEDILRDDWQPKLGPPNTPKASQVAQQFFDLGPKKFERGEEKESEAFTNPNPLVGPGPGPVPVSTHVNPLSSQGGGNRFLNLMKSAKKASSSAKKVLKEETEEESAKEEEKAGESNNKPDEADGNVVDGGGAGQPSATSRLTGGWKRLQQQWQFTQQMQKNRNLAVNAALLSDYRIANIRVLSQQLFRSLDKEEYGFITYSHVNNMKSAVWGWRGEGTAQQDIGAVTAGQGGTSGVDDIRDTLIMCLQRALKHFEGKLTVDEFIWYIINVGIPQPYNSVDLHHALTKATSVMSALPTCDTQYGVILVPGLMVLNAVATCVLTYHMFIKSVPGDSNYFKDGSCQGEGRWVDFSTLSFRSIGSGKIDTWNYIIPGILACVQIALVCVMFVLPKCKRRIFGANQDFQDTTDHQVVRKDLAQLLVVETEANQGTLGLQKARSFAFAILCAVSIIPSALLVILLGGIDSGFTNDYHTLYFLCSSYLVATVAILIRAIACAKPVGADALVAIHRDRNLLLSYQTVLPYDPEVQNALDVWRKVEESAGRTETFFTKNPGEVMRTFGSRIIAAILCLAFALSPVVMLAIEPGTCFGKGSLDHAVVTLFLAIVLFFAALVIVSDLFDIAAIHRKKTRALKMLGSVLVAKEAVEVKIPYLSAAASPCNLAAFNAMKNYLLCHYLIGDAVQTGRSSRSIGWAVSEMLSLHFILLVAVIFAAVFEWKVALYFSLCLFMATSYFLLGFNSTGSLSAAISMQRSLARLSKTLLSEASKMQVSSYTTPTDTESVRYPVEYLQNTVRALELTAKSFELTPEQRPRTVGITLSDLSISLLRVLSMGGAIASIVLASLVYE